MATIKLNQAIESLNAKAKFQYSHDKDDDTFELIDNIIWQDGTAPISKEDIQAKQTELQAEYDAQDYARKRKEEYPTIEELVVALYDTDDKAAIEEKRDAV